MIFKRIAVGLSGGVDSAVSAFILKKKGFKVESVFLRNWDDIDESGYCSSNQDFEDAQWICKKLELPLRKLDFVKEYWNEVFCNFIKDYENGLTPNPDILCNKRIKFNLFYKFAMDELKVDAIATGHYAQSSFGAFLENYDINSSAKLLRAADHFKDQTFFLCQVSQDALKKTMFPIGSLNKFRVKEIANEIGLNKIARKKESVGICFVGKRPFKTFISEYIEKKPGYLVDIDSGEKVGEHNGIHNFTLGQGVKLGGCLKPYFVYQKDVQSSTIYVASGTDHALLKTDLFYIQDPCWISGSPFLPNSHYLTCKFRFQHTKPLTNCTLYKSNLIGNKLLVKLDTKLRSITPGQYAVFYRGNECIGGSRILNVGST